MSDGKLTKDKKTLCLRLKDICMEGWFFLMPFKTLYLGVYQYPSTNSPNPLSTNVSIQILKTDLHTSP